MPRHTIEEKPVLADGQLRTAAEQLIADGGPTFWTREMLQNLSDAELYGLFTPANLLPFAKKLYNDAISDVPLPPDKQITIVGAKRKQLVRFEYVKNWKALETYLCYDGPRFPKEMVDELLDRILDKHRKMLDQRAEFNKYVKTVPTPVSTPMPTLMMTLDPVARRKKAIRRDAVADIVGFFDPNAFSVPVTAPIEIDAEIPGKKTHTMATGDANHRVCSAVALKFDLIESVEVLIDATALERAQNMFNRNVPQTALASSDAIRVGLDARDPHITAAAQLITDAGLVPLTTTQSRSADPTKIGVPINSVKMLSNKFGTETLQRLLSCFNGDYELWGPAAADSKATTVPIMAALCGLIELERAGVLPTILFQALMESWSPTALENERNTTDKTKLRRWFPASASVQSQESRTKLMLAVMLDKCYRLANASSGMSAAKLMYAARGLSVEEMTEDNMKQAASYKRSLKTLMETFRCDYASLSKKERAKIKQKVVRLRAKLIQTTNLPDWWVDNNFAAVFDDSSTAGPLFE